MIPYTKRIIKNNEVIRVEHQTSFDTIFPFELYDMTPVSYVAETKNLFELNSFIEDMRQKGASNINTYVLVKYKRWALPFSIFVLTIIGVSVSANKRKVHQRLVELASDLGRWARAPAPHRSSAGAWCVSASSLPCSRRRPEREERRREAAMRGCKGAATSGGHGTRKQWERKGASTRLHAVGHQLPAGDVPRLQDVVARAHL